MTSKLMSAVVGVVVALTATGSHAAMVYTNPADFNAAVASLGLEWSEDFEDFTPGALPAGPLSIGSGQAEIFTGGPQEIYMQTETGNLAYWNVEPPSCFPSCSADGLAPGTPEHRLFQ